MVGKLLFLCASHAQTSNFLLAYNSVASWSPPQQMGAIFFQCLFRNRMPCNVWHLPTEKKKHIYWDMSNILSIMAFYTSMVMEVKQLEISMMPVGYLLRNPTVQTQVLWTTLHLELQWIFLFLSSLICYMYLKILFG